MSVSQTSINAYRKMRNSGMINQQEFDIVNYLLKIGNSATTRREIEAGTGIRGGSVAGRVNSLLEKKVLAESLNRKCKISGMTVNTIRVYLNKQSELF